MTTPKLVYSNDIFNCHLFCGQCEFIKINGQRCGNRVCYGTPVCWVHRKMLYGVRISDSTIESGGKGLFATRFIPRFAWICPYVGDEIDNHCLDLRYPNDRTATYAIAKHENVNIDSACRRGIASMANGKFRANGRSQPRNMHNAITDLRQPMNELWIRAWKNIQEGQEIFVWYGHDYRLTQDHSTSRNRLQDSRPC